MKIIFCILLISYLICKIEGVQYDNIIQLKKNEWKIYDGTYSSLTVLDISNITEDNIYIKFNKRSSFNTETIKYNFTNYFSQKTTYNFTTIKYIYDMTTSQKKKN